MKTQDIIDTMTTKVKSILQNHAEQLDRPLSIENAEDVVKIIGQATSQAAAEGLKTYLMNNEIRENTVVHHGQKYYFNRTSSKEFQTTFGKIVLKRRLYQNHDGESFIPLDHVWNMEGQFATAEVREAVLYALALMPASEAHPLFAKFSPFQMAESSLKKIATEIEDDLENGIDDILETIRQEEVVPAEETKVIAVSMDGANVLLQEPGKKKGRKRQRPGERWQETEGGFDSPTSYKNAVVGSVSLYGELPPDEKAPMRLQSRYVARMPEEKSLTLKRQLQNEVESMLKRLPESIVKVFVSDAAQGIRKEIDTNPLFDDFEKIVDFYHATDHLSNAAEAIFGKGNSEGDAWYESKRRVLLEDVDGSEKVYRSLSYFQKRYRYTKDRKAALDKEVVFFRNNKPRMEYRRFRDNGWPIGSGVIEAACKSVVKCRFCRSGMRWTRTGGQTILTLRSVLKSGRWNAFWNLYKNARLADLNKISA